MQRVDAGYVYELGYTVRSLRQFRHQTEVQAYQIWAPLSRARQEVNSFISQSIYSASLRTCYPSASAFIAAIDAILLRIHTEKLTTLSVFDLATLFEAFDKFEPVLSSELSAATTYLVQPKGAYDVAVLVEAGERMFPGSLHMKAPEAVFDLQQGCKALAFELWTAAAFHFHRANESVLRRYFDHVAGNEKRPKTVTMGTLLARLKEFKAGDSDIIAALDNIKTFHRNPIIHPGQNLADVDETLGLAAAIRASIGYMLDKLPMLALDELMEQPPAPQITAADAFASQ